MKKYNKIVRDKIPEIIEKKGKQFKTKTVSDKAAIKFLCKKVKEELKEFEDSKYSKEELADLMEVVQSISDKLGYDIEEIYELAQKKYTDNGGFEKNIILLEVEE